MKPIKKLSEKEAAYEVVKRLQEAGHIAYFAGGCVRDALLGRAVSDYDVATSAKPRQVQKLFRKTLSVGVQFGIVVALLNKHQIEIATFRADGEYLDGRRPESIQFSSPEEDASRRDFTINGLFFDPIKGQVLDLISGRDDLWRGRIRAIGRAEDRILEDHLRLLRAVRFASRLNFRVESETRTAIEKHCGLIRDVSPERVKAELEKILKDPSRARGIAPLLDYGLLKALDMNLYVDLESRRVESIRQLELLPSKAPVSVAWAVFLGRSKTADRILRMLKSSNELREGVMAILSAHELYLDYTKLSLAKRKRLLRRRHGTEHRLYSWSYAASRSGDLESVIAAANDYQRYGDQGDGSLSARAVIRGQDLMALGLTPGPLFKSILQSAEDAQLEGETDKQALLTFLKKRYAKHFS